MKKNIILLLLLTCLCSVFGQDLRQDKAMTHFNWGNEFLGNSEYYLAILEYTGTIEIMPDYYRAYYRRGNAYYLLGEHQRAILDYNRAIKIFPTYTEAFFNRGIAYFNRGEKIKYIDDIKRSIDDWETVLRLEPGHVLAKEYLEKARKLLEELQPPVTASKPPRSKNSNITIFTHSNNNEKTRIEYGGTNSVMIITEFPDKK